MTAASNLESVRRIIDELWNQGDTDLVDEIYNPTTLIAMLKDTYRGRDGVRQMVADYREAFPDIEITIDDLFGTDEAVGLRWTCQGTHRGPFMDLEATGRSFTVSGASLIRFKDGQIIEERYFWDRLDQLSQLGFSPENLV